MKTAVWLNSPEEIETHLRRDIPQYALGSPGVRFIICSPDNQVMLHAQVGESDAESGIGFPDDLPDDGLGDGCGATIIRWIGLMAEHGLLDGLLIALTRPGRQSLTEEDRDCYRAAVHACTEHGVRLIGVHVVTPRGPREIVLDDVL